jgi:lipopolysaccharide biosynthesis protein
MGREGEMKIAVLLHMFYHDLWDELADYISNLQLPFDLYVNLVKGNHFNWLQALKIKSRFPVAVVQKTENRGRDIGGFLRLIATVLQSGKNYDVLILIHSKKSPAQPSLNGAHWRADLMQSILGYPARTLEIAAAFATDPRLGMVGSRTWLLNQEKMPEYAVSHNKVFIDEYCRRFDLKPDNSDFIAGTMFWVRAKPFLGFFAKHEPLALAAELETGDPQDTQGPTRTHAWERLFGYIVTSQGYTIRGMKVGPPANLAAG